MRLPVIPAGAVRVLWPDGREQRARLASLGKAGGAGEVYALEGQEHLVAKLYHAALGRPQLSRYERRIGWMVRHRPQLPPVAPEHSWVVQLAWPVATVIRGGAFAGFVMEKIDFERTLELDYLLTRRQAAQEGFEADFGRLVTVCHNLASVVNSLHTQDIAVVDLKPINLKVYKAELYVSILDCDGFRLPAGGSAGEAPQVTPEYLAPEFHGRAVTDARAQDRFALATIIFRLLNYGIHPYAGVAGEGHTVPAELAGRIREGLYPYGRLSHGIVRPGPASVHECFPGELRELFDRAFAPGSTGRASAHEWVTVLGGYANPRAGRMSRCELGHLQFAGQACPSCLREGVIGRHARRRQRYVARVAAVVERRRAAAQSAPFATPRAPGAGGATGPAFQSPAPYQGSFGNLQMAPVLRSLRNMISTEILWVVGLIVTLWWVQ